MQNSSALYQSDFLKLRTTLCNTSDHDKRTRIGKLWKQTHCPLQKFQELAGKLQHASFSIPGGKALFSPVHRAMRTTRKTIALVQHLEKSLRQCNCWFAHINQTTSNIRMCVHWTLVLLLLWGCTRYNAVSSMPDDIK